MVKTVTDIYFQRLMLVSQKQTIEEFIPVQFTTAMLIELYNESLTVNIFTLFCY